MICSFPQVYLSVYLQRHPLEEEAVVISMGAQSFTVNVPKLGLTSRLFLDKIPNVNATYNEVEGVLELHSASTANHNWTTASIKILSKIVVRCTVADKTGPIETHLDFIRPVASST